MCDLTLPLRRAMRMACLAAVCLAWPAVASAQVGPCPEPQNQPPAGSGPTVKCIELFAHPVNETLIPVQTYALRLQAPRTVPAQNQWAAYDEAAIQADFWNLWNTGFLDNLWIEVLDEPFTNGVMGKHVVFHIEERSKVKDVRYLPVDPDDKLKINVTDIEDQMTQRGVVVRLDSFVDDSTIRRVRGIIQELHTDKGYLYATVEPEVTPLPSGPKLVSLTFNIDPGPKVQIREIAFEGNTAFDDGDLRGKMKENKQKGWLSWITSGGTYYENKFAEDAEAIAEFYRNKGYARALVGNPEVEELETSADGKTRYIRLNIPVDEGPRYTIGTFDVTGDMAGVPEDFFRRAYEIEAGDTFERKKLDEGAETLGDVYGGLGYPSWSPEIIYDFKDFNLETGQPIAGQPPVIDITINSVPGTQQFINRITFTGNTTTHDRVIRREMRVREGGVFNTPALRDSIRRLNQLGYFKPFEDANAMTITPVDDDKVDISIQFEEQNRNQLTFGAGVSQFDGFFGQLGFQTSNFLGRGETLGISLQRGSQAENYQFSFSEPYLLDRPISVGFDVFKREYRFPFQYTQGSTGVNFLAGYPLADFTRGFIGYSYEEVEVKDIDPVYLLPEVIDSSPFLRDSLLIDSGGRRTVSRISPSVTFNTVDHPVFPGSGRRLTAAFDLAGLGGNTEYVQTRLEAVQIIPFGDPFSARFGVGMRAESRYIRPYGDTETLPIFERLFLGGEYSVRGFDLRSIGPRDDSGRIVLGGNKTALFNAEFYVNIVPNVVRLVAFYDAGQVRDIGQSFSWWEDVVRRVPPPSPLLSAGFSDTTLTDPNNPTPSPTLEVIGRRNAFKTSTGLELRFFMPVLNVPFRLIAAYNPQRGGVLTNNLRVQPRFTFRFAVGTTF